MTFSTPWHIIVPWITVFHWFYPLPFLAIPSFGHTLDLVIYYQKLIIISGSWISLSDHHLLVTWCQHFFDYHLSLSLTSLSSSPPFISNLNPRVKHYNDSLTYTFNSVYPFCHSHFTKPHFKASSLPILCLHLCSNHANWSHLKFMSLTVTPLILPNNHISLVIHPAILLDQGLADPFCKGPVISILGFAGHTVSSTTTPLCHCSRKVAIGNR